MPLRFVSFEGLRFPMQVRLWLWFLNSRKNVGAVSFTLIEALFNLRN